MLSLRLAAIYISLMGKRRAEWCPLVCVVPARSERNDGH